MAEGKNSFVLYTDLLHTVEKLPDDQAGKLFKIILEYVNDMNPEIEDLLLQVVFEPIKQQMKRDLKKWEKYIEKQRENGKKGGRPKKTQESQGEPKKPNPLNKNPTEPKKADNVNVNVIEDVIENVTSKPSSFSLEVTKVYNDSLIFFKGLEPSNFNESNKWRETIDKLNRIDGLDLSEVYEIIRWARTDDFWKSNFMSVLKLRKKNKEKIPYWKVFQEKMKNERPSQSQTSTFQDEVQKRTEVIKQTQSILNFDADGNLID